MRLGSEETEGMTHEMLSIGFLSIEGKGSGLTQVIGLGYIEDITVGVVNW